MLMRILLLCCKPSPNMALGFVYVQYLPCFRCKRRIDLNEAFGHILMYRTLRYSECLSRLPHCGIAVDDIVSDADGTLLNIILQKNTPQESFLQCMKDSRGV